jgi:predicted lipopolysaccharide heptosyltransferase III
MAESRPASLWQNVAMPKTAFSAAGLRRALVIKLRHHGDVLLAAPVISALKHHAPACEVDALVYADTAPMLEGHPALSRLHLIDRHWKRQGLKRQGAAELRLIAALRAQRYDLVIHLSVHTRGAWLVRLLRPRWSVAPKFRPGFWAKSFTHLYPAQSHPDRHTVDTNLDSLRALGIDVTASDRRVTLVPGVAAEARIDALLAAHGLDRSGFVHVHPASRWAFKCWPAERVAALCDALAAKGLPIVLTSAPDANEMALIAAVQAARVAVACRGLDIPGIPLRVGRATSQARKASQRRLSISPANCRSRNSLPWRPAPGCSSASIRRRCTSPPRWARRPSASSGRRAIVNGGLGTTRAAVATASSPR